MIIIMCLILRLMNEATTNAFELQELEALDLKVIERRLSQKSSLFGTDMDVSKSLNKNCSTIVYPSFRPGAIHALDINLGISQLYVSPMKINALKNEMISST